MVAMVVFYPSHTVLAVGFSEPPEITNREKAHLNISFTGGGEEKTRTCSASSTPLSGGENTEKAFNFFVGKGFTEKQAAGILGNFLWESGMNPKRVQGAGNQQSENLPSSGGYGLAQWDDRKQLLKKFSEDQGRPIYDLGLQLDFVMFELKGDPAKGGSTESAAYAAFTNTTTIQEATDVWRTAYERPGDPAIQERRDLANKTYGDFATAVGNPAPQAPTSTETSSCGGSGDIVGIAQSELAKGVLEQPIGCDSGNPSVSGDCGAEVNKYTDNTLEYWCADFVSWVYKEAGKPFTGGVSGGWRLPSVEGIQAWMQENGEFVANTPSSPDPQPGDVYVINNGEHIGIVVKVEGGNLYTISGNTSTDNFSNGVGVGDAVYSNYKSDSRITGYGGLR